MRNPKCPGKEYKVCNAMANQSLSRLSSCMRDSHPSTLAEAPSYPVRRKPDLMSHWRLYPRAPRRVEFVHAED